MGKEKYSVLNIESAEHELSLDAATIIELAKELARTREEYLSPIRSGIKSEDAERVREYAHRLKGIAFNLRIDRVGNRAFELERSAAGGDLSECEGLLQSIETLFVSLQEELEQAESERGGE